MRWFRFLLLLVTVLILQTGMARVLGLGPQRIVPDLLLLLMIVLVFRGTNDQVLVAGWLLGLAKDLSSEAPLGSYALGFGLLALTIMRLRELLYPDRLLPMMMAAFVGSFLTEQFAFLICLLKGAPLADQYDRLTVAMLFSAALTAALLPYVHWLITKLQRHLGLPGRRGFGADR